MEYQGFPEAPGSLIKGIAILGSIIHSLAWDLAHWGRKIRHYGRNHYCPLCNSHLSRFVKHHPTVRRPAPMCPVCYGLERHRIAWIFLTRHTDLLAPIRRNMLHLAPEPQLILKFNALKHIRYISADLDSPIAMMKMDITDIPFADGELGIIFCSHVLEHVDDDRKAMRELVRVLDDKGWALLDVPITVRETFEDPSVTDPDERTRLFGQPDHVRRYGLDFVDRLKEAGFEVKVIYAHSIIDEEMQTRMRVPGETKLFYCTKPSPAVASGAE